MILDTAIDYYSLFIFDVDGTLINSNHLHEKAWIRALDTFNINYERDFYNDIKGIPSLKVAKQFAKFEELSVKLCKLKQKLYLESIMQIEVYQELAKLLDLIKKYKDKKISLCTGGSRKSTQFLINKLELNDRIDFYICGDDVCEAKPSPEPYEKIVNFYSIPKNKTIVFEDSVNGIDSAISAGLSVFRVNNGKIIEFIGNEHE